MSHMPPPRIVALGLIAVLAGLAAGCDDRGPARSYTPQIVDLRVVTLAPALTQMVIELGRTEVLVGVAENDMVAPPGLPVVGNYTNINTERLLALQPTHVLMMAGKEGAPRNLRDLATSQGIELVVYEYPNNVAELSRIFVNDRDEAGTLLSPASVGTVLGVPMGALERWNATLEHMAAIDELLSDRDRREVLLVIGLEPIRASGPNTVLDRLLSFAGGRNASYKATVQAPEYDHESLLKLSPEVIVLLMPGAPPLESIETDPRLGMFRDTDIPAVRDRRVVLVNSPLTTLPTASIDQVTAMLAKAIHADLAPQIDQVLAGELSFDDESLAGATDEPDSTSPAEPDEAPASPDGDPGDVTLAPTE